MKVVSIIGARPQFIKAAVVSRSLRERGREVLVHTGQHYDENMSGVFFRQLGLPTPDVNLGVGSGSHAAQTAAMLVGVEKVLVAEKPDWVLVYGDTNSTLAGALAAAKLRFPLAHVEAGLRSYNRAMPEEINRVLTDQVSDLLFCPTDAAAANLAREGVTHGVYAVGDVMLDALQQALPLARETAHPLDTYRLLPRSYALLTIHRAGNTDDFGRLQAIFAALGRLDLPVVFPVHPRTRQAIQENGLILPTNVCFIDPVGYLEMLVLEENADCMITDSGGMQKEAYWLGVRCITLREETEWTETVAQGWNRLVGVDPYAIIAAVQGWVPAGDRPPVYGQGQAAGQIAAILAKTS